MADTATSTSPVSKSARSERARLRGYLGQLGSVLLAIALAIVIWLIAVSQENPVSTQDFPERIPVTVRGLDTQLQSVQDLGAETVRVTLRAPQSAWADLDAADLGATVDLSDYGSGTHDVPITAIVNDPRVTVLAVSPPSLRIQLDPVESKTLTVTAQVLDAPAFGYDAGAPVVTPPTITVQGPSTQVDLVTQIVAPVYLLNAKSQVERTVEARALNRQNQQVEGVELNTTFVHVVVPVEQWPGRKEVAVRINLVGQPAAGYRLSTVRAEPSTVVLQGQAEVLASVPGYIETEPLSIDGATSDVRQRLNLVVPEGVTVFDGGNVQAVVSITPIEGGTTVTVRPIVQGLGPNLEATVSPETVDVILSGPIPLLDSLNTDDMFVILDLSGLLPGTHVVTPRVVLPDGIRQEGVLPETVEVVISAPTATPNGESGGQPGASGLITGTVPITGTGTITGTVLITGTAGGSESEATPVPESAPDAVNEPLPDVSTPPVPDAAETPPASMETPSATIESTLAPTHTPAPVHTPNGGASHTATPTRLPSATNTP